MVHRETEQLIAIVCDVCGAETDTSGKWKIPGLDKRFDHETVEISRTVTHRIELTSGTYYPDFGTGTTTKIADICPTCFRDRVIPALEKIVGRELVTTEWDY